MKGLSLLMLAVFLIIIVFILIIPSVGFTLPLLEEVTSTEVKIRIDSYTMNNALDGARIYLQSALDYSVYQGCYDVLKNGGWGEIPEDNLFTYSGGDYALWWDSSRTVNPQGGSGFESELKEGIRSVLNGYTRMGFTFLDQYPVVLQDYSALTLERGGFGFRVSGSSGNLVITKTGETFGEEIRIERNSDISEDYDLDCFGVFEKGSEVNNEVSGNLDSIVSNEMVVWNGMAQGTQVKMDNCEAVLSDSDTADDNVFKYIFGEVDGISETEDYINGNIKTAIDSLSGEGYVVEGAVNTEIERCQFYCERVGDDMYIHNNCGYWFLFGVEAVARVTITDTGDKVPVDDGEDVVMDNIKLVFLNRYCDLGDCSVTTLA